MSPATREAWLNAATEQMRVKLFDPLEHWLPPIIRVSVGLCGGKAIGLCVDPDCAADGSSHIFLDPKLSDPIPVLATLLHELVHASVGHECKHRGKFVVVIRELGLDGKPTATFAAEGSELHATLSSMAMGLGPYPHSPLQRKPKETKPSNWIAYISESLGEDYVVRANKNTVKELGVPRDPKGDPMIPKNIEDREEEADDDV